MTWYGPRGDCDCRSDFACPCADSEEHELDDLFYDAPSAELCGEGTYIRATLTGLQSQVDFSLAEAVIGGTIVNDYRAIGLDDLNGFWDYLIIGGKCIPTSFVDHGSSEVLTDEVIIPPFAFRRFDIGGFRIDNVFRTGYDGTDCSVGFEDELFDQGNYATGPASRVILSRSVINDIEITYELRGAPVGVGSILATFLGADASIKCSENFAAAEVPIFIAFPSYTMPDCAPSHVVNEPFQVGSLKLELIRK
jgi:hypothetical protein